MFLRRLFNRPDASDVLNENTRLRNRVRGLELDLARRRTDDILSTRDHLLPIPKPGSSGAKLLSRNRSLQKRLQALIAERSAIAQDLVDAANEARAAGMVKLAASLRQRAEALTAARTPLEVEAVDSDVLDDCAGIILRSWNDVPDREALVSSWWARLTALAPAASAHGMPRGLATLAHILVLTLAGKPDPADDRPGPVRAASFLLDTVKLDVTDDVYAVASESTLYAMAGALGHGWTEEIRMAWCRGLDALARAAGLGGMSGTVLFSYDEWSEGSKS